MYSVPIVPPDLRHEETIIQSINALDYLQKTIADVFDRVDARIERNNVKIRQLQSRIEAAHTSINSLVGINKAIKIFSPAKFPAAHVFQDIPKTFGRVHDKPKFQVNRDYKVLSSLDPVAHRNIQDKLVFYHVRTSMQTKNSKMGRVMDQKQGLGKVPQNIKSVNSLLRFNTMENVYQKGGIAESSLGKAASSKKREKPSHTGQKIEAPPISMTNRIVSDKKHNSGLFYTPKLNEAPALDVPMDLPDLPGIADDITFSQDDPERIAPSFYIDNLPDLPEPENIPHAQSDKTASESENIEAPPMSAQPPPPPPPPVAAIQAPKAAVSPPPPPPPPAPVPSPSIPTATPASPSTPAAAEMADARMNLMEAIRKTGGLRGAKLRTAAAAEVSKTSEPESKKTGSKPSGDLMADLHNKLLMRRKGISGAKDQNQPSTSSSSGNVMDRLSALIPPPPPKTAPVAQSSATDGSDENDDWTD
ncbi:unnamed protein product [Hermetia illucens]|uniref:WASH1 WAHD domain-containing protein n=1 Tax=Hermetia illucens TaxID=343691 RepID=A0A7R8YYF0_HERIL|nr:WASH complex subunit 1 [Hermetia illucens]CAD7088892.1 unnamed protein product [Hermetia illucens]